MIGNLHTLVQEFLFYLEVERGYSKRTAEAYEGDLAKFLRHLEDTGLGLTPDDVTVDAVRSWMVSMHQRGLSNASIGRHLAGLRSFWKFLRFKGTVVSDVPFQVTAPKRHRPLPIYLGPEDLKRLLDATLHQRVAYCAFRDFAVMSTLIFAGLRRGEIINLKVTDIDLTEDTLRVVAGKGNKTRVIPIVPELHAAIADWMEIRLGRREETLFLTIQRGPIDFNCLHKLWKRALRKSGIDRPGVSLHTMRHSFATLLLQSGEVDLVSIMNLLGHTRLDTTAVYLHIASPQMRSAVHAHPLSKRPEQ